MIKIDDKRIKEFETDLKRFKRRAYPFATKATINNAAWEARGFAQENIRNGMTTRNRFTVNSVQVEQSRTLNVSRQAATVGSIADYMEDQEFGGVAGSTGKKGRRITTNFAAGLPRGARPRTRVPGQRSSKHISKIRLSGRRRKAQGEKQELLFKVQDAVMTGKRDFYHDFYGKKKGIFRVVGGSKSFKRGWPRGAEISMLYDLTERSVVVPRNPWLAPAVTRTERELPRIYAKALRFQLRRFGLFKDS